VPPWGLPVVACVLLAGAQVAAGAEEAVVHAQRRGDGVEVRARAFLAVPREVAWQVLTDYEQLPAFIPGIRKSVVRERQGNRLRLEQSGEARFLFFSFPIEVVLEVSESPRDWVVSRSVRGNLRRMLGRYELLGEPGRGGVLLLYSGFVEPDFELPPLVGAAALRSMAEDQFRAMVKEIERRALDPR
jgi:ribosome-associated toxin RatA of RatAB toxin-antitoxin module